MRRAAPSLPAACVSEPLPPPPGGLKEPEMAQVARWIARIFREGEDAVAEVKASVEDLMRNYPLYA